MSDALKNPLAGREELVVTLLAAVLAGERGGELTSNRAELKAACDTACRAVSMIVEACNMQK